MSRIAFYKTRTYPQSTTNKFRLECETNRRDSRFSLMLKRRNITTLVSPIESPVPVKKEDTKKSVVEDKLKKRYEMLQKYKMEKKKKLEELKAKSKPIFKVQHVSNSVNTDYAELYRQIKGKPILLQKKQNPIIAGTSTNTKNKNNAKIETKKSVSTEVTTNVIVTLEDPKCSLLSLQSSNNKIVEAVEMDFSKLLSDEIERLKALCNDWKTYEEEIKPPEETCDMIHAAIGQTELLIRNKFKKFAELINLHGSNDSECKVTFSDLHGFWDVVSMEIKNVNQRFETLSKLKTNNWDEVLLLPVKKTRNVKNNDKKKPEVKSNMRDFIKEKRKKNLHTEKHSLSAALVTINNNSPIVLNLSPNENCNGVTRIQSSNMYTPTNGLKYMESSSTKISKSVAFLDIDDKENCPRRSIRLRAKKIKSDSDLDVCF